MDKADWTFDISTHNERFFKFISNLRICFNSQRYVGEWANA